MRMTGTAFASDLDGTLCESDWNAGIEHFDPKDIEAVRRYQEAGGLFGICTGRPLFSVLESCKGFVDFDFYIVNTGAQVLTASLESLSDRPLGHELARELSDRYGQREGSHTLVVTDTSFVCIGRPISARTDCVPSIADVPGTVEGVSFEFMGDEESARLVADDLNRRYAGVLEGFQNLGSVDVVRAGCSKGAGLAIAKSGLGVRLIAGIGDSYNDRTLLEAADVAYTFHKAPDMLRSRADRVVSSVAEALGDFMDRA